MLRHWLVLGVLGVGLVSCRPPASGGTSSIRNSRFASSTKSRIFTWAIRAPIRDLDPAVCTESINSDVLRQVFSGLTKLGGDGRILPDLAQSWTISADARTYEFRIDRSRTFVSGKPVEAADIARSLNRTLNPKVGAVLSGELLGGVTGIAVVAPDRLRMTLKSPVRSFLARLSYPGLGIVGPATPADAPITKVEQMDGAGPFAVTRFVTGQQMDLKARGQLGLDGLRIQIIPDVNVRVSKFVAGEIDLATVATLDAEQWRGKPELHLMPRSAIVFVQINPKTVPALRDVRVRRALWMAINRKNLIESTTRNVHQLPDGLVPPGPGLSGKPNLPPYDPAGAATLLAQAGYPNGKGFPELSVYYGDNGRENPTVDAIVTDWRTNLGITARGRAMENGALRELDQQGKVGLYFTGYSGDYQSDDDYLPVMFGSTSSVNHSGFRDSVVDAHFASANLSASDTEIARNMAAAHQRIVDAVPVIPIFFTVEPELVNPRWTGLTFSPFGHLTLDTVSLINP